MSITIFPAQQGTFMIERDASVVPPRLIRVPVIGWQHVQGNLAYPVCVMNHGGLTHGKAILHPEGFVTDAVHGLTFEDTDEWLSYMKSAKSPKSAAEPADDDSDDRAAAMPEEPAEEPDEPATAEDEPETVEPSVPLIQFGTKTFKTNSFWSMPSINAIFQIEGGLPYPKDDRCEKVTRDEWAKLKREGAAVIDPHSGEVPDEEDDDAMDLV